MPLMSPGGEVAVLRPILAVVRAATLLLILTPSLSNGDVRERSENVVIEIGNIKQPDNCSLFLTNLEVTITTRSICKIMLWHFNVSS